MPTTTVQVDLETHRALKEVKQDMTFDELFRLYLQLVPAEEIRRIRDERERAYEAWQAEVAEGVRRNAGNKRLF